MNRRDLLRGGSALVMITTFALGGAIPFLRTKKSFAQTGDDTASDDTTNEATASDAAGQETARLERVLGSADAPVTIIEYASLTCPHCAGFHTDTLPTLHENWIDTGKANLIYRHFPLDGVALRAALAANCLESDKAFFAFIGVLFKQQSQWIKSGDPMGQIQKLAQFAGLSADQFETCTNDEAAMNQILAGRIEASNSYNIKSTPTFVIGNTVIAGNEPYPVFDKILTKAYENADT